MSKSGKHIKEDRIQSEAAKTGDAAVPEGEWKSRYLRALADYQNLEKRNRDEAIKRNRQAGESLIADLIPVLDMFGLARVHLVDRGLDLAVEEFLAVLKKYGVTQIYPKDREFDPATMECVEAVAAAKNRVTEVVLPGYDLNGKLLRPAKVKVGNGEKQNNTLK